MNHKSKARSYKRRRWKENYYKRHRRKQQHQQPNNLIQIRPAKRQRRRAPPRINKHTFSHTTQPTLPQHIHKATILFRRRFNTINPHQKSTRQLIRLRSYRRRSRPLHTPPWLPRRQLACLCNTCVSLDRPKTHVKLCHKCDANTKHLCPSTKHTSNITHPRHTYRNRPRTGTHLHAINPYLTLTLLIYFLTKQIFCTIRRLAHQHTYTPHTAIPIRCHHNDNRHVTSTTNTNSHIRQPSSLSNQRRRSHTDYNRYTTATTLLLFGLHTIIQHNSFHTSNTFPNTNTPHMTGQSILTTIFNNNNPDVDENTTTSQQTHSPSLLSDATTDDLYAAETQQINNSASHKLSKDTSPGTDDDTTPNNFDSIIAETENTTHPLEYSDYVPPSITNMPTNVHVQIQHAASPESYTDRATSSTTAASNTISSNNNDQSAIKAAEINPQDKGDQTLCDAAYSTPTRPPPGMPSISTYHA